MKQDINKSLHKAIMKNRRRKTKDVVKDIVDDIEDPNSVAEVPEDDIPATKENVLNKSESGISKLKRFIDRK